MVDILKRGKPPAERTYTVPCSKCHSVLRAKKAECRGSPDQRDAGHLIFDCPVCDGEVFFYAERHAD